MRLPRNPKRSPYRDKELLFITEAVLIGPTGRTPWFRHTAYSTRVRPLHAKWGSIRSDSCRRSSFGHGITAWRRPLPLVSPSQLPLLARSHADATARGSGFLLESHGQQAWKKSEIRRSYCTLEPRGRGGCSIFSAAADDVENLSITFGEQELMQGMVMAKRVSLKSNSSH